MTSPTFAKWKLNAFCASREGEGEAAEGSAETQSGLKRVAKYDEQLMSYPAKG